VTLPGVVVETTFTVPGRSVPTDTGQGFLVGIFERGPVGQETTLDDAVHNMTELVGVTGNRFNSGGAYDEAETFFREGGDTLYLQRVVGSAAAVAQANVTSTGTTLIVKAKTPGAWANGATGGLKHQWIVGPINGGSFRVLIITLNGVEVERSPEYNDRTAWVTWSANSDWVDVALGGGSGVPAVAAAANLAGGNDDLAGITQNDVDDAWALFDEDLGPGQLLGGDWQTDAAHLSMLQAAADNNRFALCDPIDTTNKSTLLAAASALRGSTNGSYGMLVAPWLTVPGSAPGSAGRSVPPSAFVAGKMAVADHQWSANQAAAGSFGLARWVNGVKAKFSRKPINGITDAEDLNDAGVNLVISKFGAISLYANRTLVDPAGAEQVLLQASNARYRMSLVARLKARGEPYEFARITPRTIENFNADLTALMLRDYTNGDLFGDLDDDRPETAFNVNTGDTVNTPETIADGKFRAHVAYRAAPGAELVDILLTAVAANQSVA
jgi:hypothetical protein